MSFAVSLISLDAFPVAHLQVTASGLPRMRLLEFEIEASIRYLIMIQIFYKGVVKKPGPFEGVVKKPGPLSYRIFLSIQLFFPFSSSASTSLSP